MKDYFLQLTDRFVRIPSMGLDISERNTKYLLFTQRPPFEIDAFGEIQIPEGMIEQGEIRDENGLSGVFQSWLKKSSRRVRSSYATISMPEEKSFVRVLQLPKMKQGDLVNAIRWELEANVPIPPSELVYDYEIIEPIEDHINHIDIVITAFPRSIIESYVRVLKKAGIKIYALELESQAIIRSLIKELSNRKSYIVVDMGRNRTSFIIFSGGAIRFTTTIPLGGTTIEENIMKALHISDSEALELKKTVGLAKNMREGKIFSALIPAMAAFADELHRAIFYFQDHSTHTHGAEQTISTVLLSGGEASLKGLDTYLASSLKIPVLVGDPFASIREHLSHPVPPLLPNMALAYTTAIGLALRNLPIPRTIIS